MERMSLRHMEEQVTLIKCIINILLTQMVMHQLQNESRKVQQPDLQRNNCQMKCTQEVVLKKKSNSQEEINVYGN